jgi:hypothetical protein
MSIYARQHDCYGEGCDENDTCYEIQNGIRCRHGNIIPGPITDIECPECQIDYGPSLYPFDGTLERMIQNEMGNPVYDTLPCPVCHVPQTHFTRGNIWTCVICRNERGPA